MKIVTTVKQVASRDAALQIDPGGRWVDESGLAFEVNEPDAYSLEAALLLKDQLGGEVVVLCAGPERVGKAIREALAKGADRAIHIDTPHPEQLDTFSMARLLAKAIETESPDLVLTGLQSDDWGAGQTGVAIGEILGWPHASLIVSIEKTSGGLRVRRELEGGWFQYIDLPLPAVLTIQSGIARLRYATLMGIKRARTKEVKVLPAGSLGGTAGSGVAVERLYEPGRTKSSQIFSGPPADTAARLVEKLRFEARVL